MSTTCLARVENGAIRLPEGIEFPEGCEVRVTIPPGPDEADPGARADARSASEAPRGSFLERYARFIGDAHDLPSDYAENHDHYLHGHPKR